MPVITRLQERRRVALAAEEERERQVYLAQSQFVHASSGGRIIRVNGVLTHAPPEGGSFTIVFGVPRSPRHGFAMLNRHRFSDALQHPNFMWRPNMDDPFPTTPFDVLDPIPPRTSEYFSQYVLSYPHYVHSTATNRIVTRSSRLFPGYVICAPSFVWNKLFFLH